MNLHLLKFDSALGLKDIYGHLAELFGRKQNGAMHYGAMEKLPDWRLSVDICESDSAYVISGDIPGVRQEDVSVSVRDGMLIIQGDRKQAMLGEGSIYSRKECPSGYFVRNFGIPDDADSSLVKTEFRDGMFRLTLPKIARPIIQGYAD